MRNNARTNSFYLALAAAALLASSVPVSEALRCYQCTIKPPASRNGVEGKKPCASFAPTKDYEVDCPDSTFCMKHTYWLPLLNGTVEGVLRDCAPQRYHYREFENDKWERKMKVDEEAYEEGCFVSRPEHRDKPTTSEYCYCNHHLCNSGKGTHDATSAAHTDAMAVIFVFNAMKYIRSLRV